jgi:AcrR family transcriptional regulator
MAQAETLTRRERKKQRTHNAIVAAARELFAVRGYDDVTIPEIAERAEVAVSTVFAHFPSKDAIFFSGWSAMTEELERFIADAPVDERVLDVLRRWYREYWPAYRASDAWWGEERYRLLTETPALDAHRRHRIAQLQRVYATRFARETGEQPQDMRPRILAATTIAATMSVNEYWYEQGLPAGVRTPADAAEYAFALVDAGSAALAALDPPPF